MARKGKILASKWGMNPNSSSLGVDVVLGEATITDADPLQLTAPGTVGFAGDEIAAYVYDEFRSDAL